ncbi:hypothetical protein MKX03_003418 [Papaver bracteatum]|nr:hypothetical protein MKX03_003418 [Papaver bracteatum]
MSSLSRELVFLILQFLDEEKFKESVHKLEQESGFFFNMKYFEDIVNNGEWDDVEKYLSGFTKVDDNRYSMKIFFEIRKQKYLEALDKHDRSKAVEILVKDLKVFSAFNDELFKEITQLLTLENFRENEQLSNYGDTKSARGIMLADLKKLIEANPLFRDKLQFPTLKNSRLRTLINQSLNWQLPHPAASAGPMGLGAPSNAGTFHPRTPTNNPAMDYQTADSEHVSKRTRLGLDEPNMPANILPIQYPRQSHAQSLYSSDELPKNVVMSLHQGSAIKSMDFHPVQQTLLLVGTNVGDIAIWELGNRERLAHRNFKIWDSSTCSMPLLSALEKEPSISVNRVMWSPDGALLGVAHSKHIVHVHSYHGGDDVRHHLEIDAHVGAVNDLAFSHPNKQLCIITCGDDKSIKVWDAVTGAKQYTFEGHEAPVFSVCPHYKENIQIKAWLYDNLGSRVDNDAPGQGCTTMLLENNESEGTVKRTYIGFRKRSTGVVQFDTTKNRFLAVGDEFLIKVWDMDNQIILTIIEADGGFPASPRIRFNKEGTLLAVSANDTGIKVLANSDGLRLLHSVEGPRTSEAAAKNGDTRSLADVKPRITEESVEEPKIWKLTEIIEPSQCRSLCLPDNLSALRVSRLIYTNSGIALLALTANAVHKLWKWQRNDRNRTGKATTNVPPQLWQPPSGIPMTNEISDTKPEDGVPCFALSKNDSYVISNNNNIIAIGMEDASIQIYNFRVYEVKSKLKGHQKRVTGLTFSNSLNVLVSSGADAQLCVWNTDGWDKQASKFLQIPTGRVSAPLAETRVQFHQDQIHFLVVHETQIAIYEAPKLECVKQWVPQESSIPITHATYSCDSQSIYASFGYGSVGVFTSTTLVLRCRINPTAYLSPNVSSRVHPLVIAAHPSEPNQIALGLSDGGVYVVEPLESEGKWGTVPPPENGAGPSITSGQAAGGSDQLPR